MSRSSFDLEELAARLSRPVSGWMSRDPICVKPQDTMVEVLELLGRHKIHGAPVVDGGRAVGVLSVVDLVQAEVRETERLDFYHCDGFLPYIENDFGAVLHRQVREFMTAELITCAPDEAIAACAERMLQAKIHRLLVVDGDALVGVISQGDILRAVFDIQP